MSSVVLRGAVLLCALLVAVSCCVHAVAPLRPAASRVNTHSSAHHTPASAHHHHQSAHTHPFTPERTALGGGLQWGGKGHSLIATIAAALVNGSVLQQAEQMAGDTLPNVAPLADEIKRQYPWSSAMHYIDVPDNTCTYTRAADCHDEKGHNMVCVDYAIFNYTTRATNTALSADERQFAIRMVVHFVGDVHQPLHVAWTSDEGGNTQKGKYDKHSDVTLHSLWDTYLLETRVDNDFNSDWDQYASYLIKQVQSGGVYVANVTDWLTCAKEAPFDACSEEWANQTLYDACNYAYVDENGNLIQNGFTLGDAYYQVAQPIFEAQLAKAGVRLARVLEAMFA